PPPPPLPPVPVDALAGVKVKSRMTISTGLPLDGGAPVHHRFIPSGSGCWGMFTVGFWGAYVQVLMRPAVPSTGCSPAKRKSVMLVLDQTKREVESVAPPRENE